jgi:hypothetical protein
MTKQKKKVSTKTNGLKTQTLGLHFDSEEATEIEAALMADHHLAQHVAAIVRFMALGRHEFKRLVSAIDQKTTSVSVKANRMMDLMFYFEDQLIPLSEAMENLLHELQKQWSGTLGVMGLVDELTAQLKKVGSASSKKAYLNLGPFDTSRIVAEKACSGEYHTNKRVTGFGTRLKGDVAAFKYVKGKFDVWLRNRKSDLQSIVKNQ